MIYPVYNLLLTALLPAAAPYALARSLVRGHAWRRLPEKLGLIRPSLHQTRPGAIWLHAVSVGEALSLAGLAERLRERFPRAKLFVSTATPAGQKVAEEKLSRWVDGFFYAPLDHPLFVRAALARIQPRLVVVMETEIWPNLFREAKRSGASLMIVNGRISDRSAPCYRRLRFFFGAVLENVDRVLAQSKQDAERFLAAGAPPDRVTVGGNLKYDFEPSSTSLPADLSALIERLQPSPLIVAGSTREDEEAPVLDAFRRIARKRPRALLVIAPRHPRRFDEAAAAIEASGLPALRRSALGADPAAELPLPGVLLLDSLGELSALYRLADVVFVGGSLNGWGGHNVLEPALYGRPVVVGPTMQNFRAVADVLLGNQALLQVADADALGEAFETLLADPEEARRLGERGRETAEAERGAAGRAVGEAAELYAEAAPRRPSPLWKSVLLGPLTLLWAAGVGLRLQAYANGLFARGRLPRPVVSLGNLTVGGTGKTPTALWLSERLSRRGFRPAVLTRGYKRVSKEPFVLSLPGERPDARRTGDEAALFRERFDALGLEVPVGVGADRLESGRRLLKRVAADLFILDDGFQRLSLERDVDCVLIDAERALAEERLLPLGRLREPLSSLARADLVLLTRTEPGCRYRRLEAGIRRWNRTAPIFRSRLAPVALRKAAGGAEEDLARLRGARVVAFCGIGAPESFRRTLESLGSELVEFLRFPDHCRYRVEDWRRIAAKSREHEADLLVTTEKDLLNLAAEATAEFGAGAAPLYALGVELVVDEEEKLLEWIEKRLGAAQGR